MKIRNFNHPDTKEMKEKYETLAKKQYENYSAKCFVLGFDDKKFEAECEVENSKVSPKPYVVNDEINEMMSYVKGVGK